MKRPNLDAIDARAKKATGGPWHNDRNYEDCLEGDGVHDTHKGTCWCCGKGPLVEKRLQPHGRTTHIHEVRTDNSYDGDSWYQITSGATHQNLTGPYGADGDERGGILSSEEDSNFIAHARTDVPELVAYVLELEGELSRTCGGGRP